MPVTCTAMHVDACLRLVTCIISHQLGFSFENKPILDIKRYRGNKMPQSGRTGNKCKKETLEGVLSRNTSLGALPIDLTRHRKICLDRSFAANRPCTTTRLEVSLYASVRFIYTCGREIFCQDGYTLSRVQEGGAGLGACLPWSRSNHRHSPVHGRG